MATVTYLPDVRRARLERAAEAAILHPALRWTAGTDETWAHRRTATGITACGITAHLRVARTSVPLCPACYGP